MSLIRSSRTFEVEATVEEVLKASSLILEFYNLTKFFDAIQTAEHQTDTITLPCESESQAYNVVWSIAVASPMNVVVDSMSPERAGTQYIVGTYVEGQWHCECADFTHKRNHRCKHILSVWDELNKRLLDQIKSS